MKREKFRPYGKLVNYRFIRYKFVGGAEYGIIQKLTKSSIEIYFPKLGYSVYDPGFHFFCDGWYTPITQEEYSLAIMKGN